MVSRILATVVAVLLSQASATAQEAGTDKCQCMCRTGYDHDGEGGRMSFVIHESANYTICPIFNDRKCEISDPDTGETHHGVSGQCQPSSDDTYEAMKPSQQTKGGG